MTTPATPGSGFTFRKKTFATPRRGAKGGSFARGEKENDEAMASTGAVTNTEFVRRSRRVLSTSESTSGVSASDALAAAAAAVAEEDLVELEFHRKTGKSSNGLHRRSSTDGCAHERTPTRGEIARIARANGATTEEEIDRAISESENEYEAKRQKRRAAEKAEEAKIAAELARQQERERAKLSAVDNEGGFDDSMPDYAPMAELPQHQEQQQQQPLPQEAQRQQQQPRKETKREVGFKRKPTGSRRHAAKLARTLSSDSKITGSDLAGRLQPIITASVSEITAKDGSRHPAVVDCIHDICADFVRHVEKQPYFRRSNMAVNPRNDELRNKERSLRILLGRLDAEASQWKQLRAEFDAQPSLDDTPFDDGRDMPEITLPDSFDPNPVLQASILQIDQVLPVVKRVNMQEREASEYISTVSQAVAREGFAAFGPEEDVRDLIKQITHE